jgi:hypothetical protein
MTSHPFIPVPNTASVELIWSVGSLLSENIIHVTKGSAYSLSDLVAVRTIVDNWDNATWKPQRSASAFLTRIRSRGLDSASGALDDYQLPAARAGTAGGQICTPSVAFVLKLTTALAGRSYRGRLYIGNLVTPSLTANSTALAQATADAQVTCWNTLKTNLAAGGHTLTVVSLRQNKNWRLVGAATPVTGISYSDLNLDSQRRRLAGRGRT